MQQVALGAQPAQSALGLASSLLTHSRIGASSKANCNPITRKRIVAMALDGCVHGRPDMASLIQAGASRHIACSFLSTNYPLG